MAASPATRCATPRASRAASYTTEWGTTLSEAGVTYASLSAELGITSGQLKTWHLELLAAGSATAIAQTKAEAAELAQLRRDNKRLKEENEVMRKASAFFAQWAAKT